MYANSFLGGIVIGISALILIGWIGRIMGVSGILGRALSLESGFWRYLFLAGIPVGSGLYIWTHPSYAIMNSHPSILIAILWGLLVGIGSSLANGCTSGHGICGVGRLSLRSIVATAIFVTFAILTTYLTHHVFFLF